MLPVLEFIFQDFWHWLGFTLMLGTVFNGIGFTIARVRHG